MALPFYKNDFMFLNLDKHNPDSIAVIDDSGSVATYQELIRFSGTFSNYLSPRSFIFILSENSLGALAGYVAALSSKIVPLILSAQTDKEQLQELYRIYQPAFIWLPESSKNFKDYDAIFKCYNYKLIQTNETSPKLHPDLSLLLPTSGSTGSPKLVRHNYENIEQNAKNVAAFFELSSEERAIAVLPMHYTMGLSVVASHLYAGACILLMKSNLTDKHFWEFIKENEATSFTGVPFSFEVLSKLRLFRMNLPHLKLLTQGGGKMSPDLFNAFANYAAENGKRFIATYGQSEGTARMAYLPADKALDKTCSIGIAIPNGVFFLINEKKEIIEEIEASGELVYKGPNVTLGYARNKEDLLLGDENNGILYTGDIARRDADGFYYITGRLKRFLKIYGSRISLDEVEQMVKDHFRIDCLCMGTDDKLRIIITDSEQTAAVKNHVIEKAGIFHQAIEIAVVNEIPRNEAGKPILK